jgi:DNA-binding LytR/AlgR family response regulator
MLINKKINCLVVDDEPPALDVLKKYIESVPSLQLAGSCSNAVDALAVIQKQAIDLLFLDIQMPQILGTDFIRTLGNPPKVIFTTAYRKYAVEGFDLNAVDFLLKPIPFERFLKAVNKVMNISIQQPNYLETNNNNNNNADKEPVDSFIHFRADRKILKIALDDILYFESLKDYIKVVTKSKTFLTKHSISSLEENLPSTNFIRIHRSYIISISKIEFFTNELVGIGKQELPISRMYRHEVEKVLKPD